MTELFPLVTSTPLLQKVELPSLGGAPRRNARRDRTRFSAAQLQSLEDSFVTNAYPDVHEREELASQLEIPHSTVHCWFQNRRSRSKRVESARPARRQLKMHRAGGDHQVAPGGDHQVAPQHATPDTQAGDEGDARPLDLSSKQTATNSFFPWYPLPPSLAQPLLVTQTAMPPHLLPLMLPTPPTRSTAAMFPTLFPPHYQPFSLPRFPMDPRFLAFPPPSSQLPTRETLTPPGDRSACTPGSDSEGSSGYSSRGHTSPGHLDL